METTTRERSARDERSRAAQIQRAPWLLAAILALALIVRVGLYAQEPHPYDNSGLAVEHAELARNIDDHGRWFVVNLRALDVLGPRQRLAHRLVDPAEVTLSQADARPTYQHVVLQPVGAGVVLAGLWKVTGDERYVYLQLLQIAIDGAMVLLVYWIALQLYRRPRTALLAALAYAVFLPVAVIARIPHLDIWAVDFTIVIVALFVRAQTATRPLVWLGATGVATGLGVYFRPGVLLLPLLLALAMVPWSRWRGAWRYGLVPLLVAALLIAPWAVRNAVQFDRFIPTRVGIGQNLWEGLGELPNDFGAKLDDQATARQVALRRPDLRYGTPAYDAYLQHWALTAIRDHPFFFARVVAHRLIDSTVWLRNLQWPYGIVEPLLFILAVAVAVVTRRRFARQHVLLAAVPLATLAPYLVLHVEPRYILPGSFVYLIWAALGADLIWERLMQRRPQNEAALASS
jgi:4-amino-4-deoxy-L-arabinose transferase-like glycosyltransferase